VATIVADGLFEIRNIADGVWVAVAAPAFKVNCNTAIIEVDDGVVIVDSHSKPSAARAILDVLPTLTPKPVRYVVNTHFHWDHWQGNEVYPTRYPDVEIVTSAVTRHAMVSKSVKRIQDQLRSAPDEIAALRDALARATSADHRAQLEADLEQAEAFAAELGAMTPALPTLAFGDRMVIVGRDREVHLLTLGRAHTEGDVFVHLPRERIVVTGDCVNGWTPFMGDAYPEEWARTLERLEQLDFTTVVLGHGEPAGKEWLTFFRRYIEDVVEAVRREAARGASVDEVKARVPDALAPRYEAAFSKYGAYRPWRQRVLGNIERTYAQVS
jgi:glyoxylase-like metal-dependent hydrolase (beta-lactamase superfamily II)